MPKLTSTYLKEHLYNLFKHTGKEVFLLAISGGADSMVLANLFLNAGFPFEVAHVNYHLRGKDSDKDQELVENFCNQHHIIFHLYDVSKKDSKPKHSIELWARKIRYGFFFRILEQQKLDFIVMGHNLNDQLETFIINLSKASGINGLTGIPENNNKIIRPLLHITKKEIYNFAKQNNIHFREDYTNQSKDYLRNQIRHDITPQIEKINSHFWDNFDKSICHLKQAKNFINDQIGKILNKIIVSHNDIETILDKEKLACQSDFVQYEILKKYGFKNYTEQKKIFQSISGSKFKGEYLNLFIYRNQLIFTLENIQEKSMEQEIILSLEQKINFPQSLLLSKNSKEHRKYWEIDFQKVCLPLKIRKPRPGDFFYPKGMKGKKLVSKFFKDEKISILERQKIWILSDSDENIIGILNYRQDRRFLPENNNPKIFLYS